MPWSSGEVATTSTSGRQTERYGRAAPRRAKAVVRLTRSAPGGVEVHDEVTALAARAAPSTLSIPLVANFGIAA
jgi:hypothetical protein